MGRTVAFKNMEGQLVAIAAKSTKALILSQVHPLCLLISLLSAEKEVVKDLNSFSRDAQLEEFHAASLLPLCFVVSLFCCLSVLCCSRAPASDCKERSVTRGGVP